MGCKTGVEIKMRQYIAHNGEVVLSLPEFAENSLNLIPLYRAMLLTRMFDEKAVSLQRTGRLGTYASSLGQEAVGVGVAAAMRKDDVLLPSFREQSAMLWRGVSMTELLLYWGGDERGSDFTAARHDFPICIPVGTHLPHATGVGFALKQGKNDAVAVAIAGDGATSKGDFYEALNVAGVWRLPVIFVINNNQWAISVPRSRQTASETLAQKAVAAGIEGVQVDGNDVVAVQQVVAQAIQRARKYNAPTLIEAVTYRLTDHTTADDASRYRSDEEVSKYWHYEPLRRLRDYLEKCSAWNRSDEDSLHKEIATQVDDAVKAYLDMPSQSITSIFDHLYGELPSVLREQRIMAADREVKDA